MILSDYLNLIPQEHRNKPKFVATVGTFIESCVHIQDVLKSIPEALDVDTAIGDQQDILAKWIGTDRLLSVPITGVYFTWDDTVPTGWDVGVWKGLGDPSSGIETLSDEFFKGVLKSKIKSNNWIGDIDGSYDIIEETLGALISSIVILDNGDMTIDITTTGLSDTEQALIEILYIKPMGISITFIHV